MATFGEILRMTPDERHALGEPILTVRWADPTEVDALTAQSWFGRLRTDLNEAGKLSVNLGVLKYEQGAPPRRSVAPRRIG
jgi:hypothetical protein